MNNNPDRESLIEEAIEHVRESAKLVEQVTELSDSAKEATGEEQFELIVDVVEKEKGAIAELEVAVDLGESVIAAESDYTSHQAQVEAAKPSKERIEQLENSLLEAFSQVITYREVPFIQFGDLDAVELAEAFIQHPIIIKPILSCVNVAQRAIKRDLGFDLDTYADRITRDPAIALAAYIKPQLPPEIAVPALMELDRFFWTDKEMRAGKGNWEKSVKDAINISSKLEFRKRRFAVDDEKFEIDAAYPAEGETIQFAVDVKRIESPRDIHKRADEIINKAAKFKKAHPEGKFVAVIYYPFPTQHINVQSRLKSPHIDGLFFAGATESSISDAMNLLVGSLGLGGEGE